MLSSLVLNVTYRCPIACDYCGLGCNPQRTERMSVDQMLDAVSYAKTLGTLRHVTFTGGEPLLHPEDVSRVLEVVTGLGWTSRVVSNGFWAKDMPAALRRVARLKDKGLTEMNLSVDDMHQKHIPLAYIKHAHDACAELGVRILLAHRALRDSKITIESLEELFGQPLFSLDEERERFRSGDDKKPQVPPAYVYSTSTYVPVGPKGHTIPRDQLNIDPIACRLRCDSVLKDLIVSPGNQIDMCCGVTNHLIPELKFSYLQAQDIGEVLVRIDKDLLSNWLVLEGPCGMAEYVNERCPEISFDGPYVNNCHLCHAVLSNPKARQVLRQVDKSKLLELYFLRQIYDAKRSDNKFASKMFEKPNLAAIRAQLVQQGEINPQVIG